MSSDKAIHLATVVGSYAKVLPQMLNHYRTLGCESIVLHLHLGNPKDAIESDVKRIMTEHGAAVTSITMGPWVHTLNAVLYRSLVSKKAADEWIIYADQDELQVYPGDLKDILNFCDSRGYDYVEGCLLDRIAHDGLLREVDETPVWNQFPLGGFVSYPLVGGRPTKIVAARAGVILTAGQHTARNGKGCPRSEIYVQVHHFKWVGSLLARIRERKDVHYFATDPFWVEQERLINYCNINKDRIDINDPFFLIAPCSPSYPHWEYIRMFVERAWYCR